MKKNYKTKTNEERNEEIKAMVQMIQDNVVSYLNSNNYKKLLRTMSKFHHYSFNNQVLILAQMPEASYVTGFQTWKKSFHRSVNAGEKGIRIFAPRHIQYDVESDDKDTRHVEYTTFRPTCVFDISQTSQIEGEEKVELNVVHELTQSVENYNEMLTRITNNVTPVPVEFSSENLGGAFGYYSKEDEKIVVCDGLPEAQTIKTLLHETAHSILHNSDRIERDELVLTHEDREIEAESVAFIVADYLGIDTSDYSIPYVASWSKEKPEDITKHLTSIRYAANMMIDAYEGAAN